MYMPGRFRTGSRPSRTGMALAAYATTAIKNALQISYLRADRSVSERAVGRGLREPESERSLHANPQRFVLDSGNELGRPLQGLRARLRNVRSRRLGRRSRRLGKMADGESQRFRRTLAELLGQPREDLGRKLPELERPGRRGGVRVQSSVARD